MQHEPVERSGLEAYAASALTGGRAPDDVRADLLKRGVAADVAEQVVAQARTANRRRGLRAGVKYLAIGIGCGVLGAVITGSTYSSAVRGGGTYVVTFGLFGFGIGYTLGGLIRLMVAALAGR